MLFRDRQQAGRVLAEHLSEYRDAPEAVVLGIPRGGVVVAAEVARELHLPLDIAVAAKIGAPSNPEYAIGAVAPDGEVSVNPSAGISPDDVRRLAAPAHEKVQRYMSSLRGSDEPVEISGKTIILVDDGLATGLTARAAVDWLKRQGAAHVVLAVPVAPPSSVDLLSRHADEVIAVQTPEAFFAVGQFYEQFGQTEDDEVREILGSVYSEERQR